MKKSLSSSSGSAVPGLDYRRKITGPLPLALQLRSYGRSWRYNIDGELQRRGIDSIDKVRRAGAALVSFSAGVGDQVGELKEMMRDRLYRHYRVSRMTEKAGRVLEQLFNTYMREPRQMPEHVLARVERDGEPLARVIADYIAGMTDRFALDEYRKLFDPDERV